jgi:hypothetical protein
LSSGCDPQIQQLSCSQSDGGDKHKTKIRAEPRDELMIGRGGLECEHASNVTETCLDKFTSGDDKRLAPGKWWLATAMKILIVPNTDAIECIKTKVTDQIDWSRHDRF